MLNVRVFCLIILISQLFFSYARQNQSILCDSLLAKARDAIDIRPDLTVLYTQYLIDLYTPDKIDRCFLTALRYRGLAYLSLGEQEKARQHLYQSYVLSRQLNDSFSWSASASNLFHFHFYYDGNVKKAEAFLNEAYYLATRLRDSSSVAIHLMNYGELAFMKGNVQRALFYFQNAASLEASRRNAAGVADAYVNIALAWFTLRDTIHGLYYLKKAYEIYKSVHQYNDVALTATNLAFIYALRNQCKEARSFIQEALHIREKGTDKKALAQSYFVYARVLQCEGHIEEAEKWFFRGSRLSVEVQNYYQLATAFYEQGKFYLLRQDTTRAIQYFQNSLEFAEDIEYKILIDSALIVLAQLHAQLGDWKKAYFYQQRLIGMQPHNKPVITAAQPSVHWKQIAISIFIIALIIIVFCIIIIILQQRIIRKKLSERE